MSSAKTLVNPFYQAKNLEVSRAQLVEIFFDIAFFLHLSTHVKYLWYVNSHCLDLDLDLNGKRPGITSGGNLSSSLIGRS